MTTEELAAAVERQALGVQQAAEHLQKQQAPFMAPAQPATLTPLNLVLGSVAALALIAAVLEHGMVREANATITALAKPAQAQPQLNLQPLVDAVNANRRLTDLLATNMMVLVRRVNALSEAPKIVSTTNAAATNTPVAPSKP